MNHDFNEYVDAVKTLSGKAWKVLEDERINLIPEDFRSKIQGLHNALEAVNYTQQNLLGLDEAQPKNLQELHEAQLKNLQEIHESNLKNLQDCIHSLLWAMEQPNLNEAIKNTLIEGVKAKNRSFKI